MMNLVELKPPSIAFALLAVSFGLHLLVPENIGRRFSMPLLGSIGIIAGFAVMIWAWKLFQEKKTPIRPTDEPSTLVADGPFRFSRNPMYLGIILMLTGVAVWVGSLPMFLAPIAFFIVLSIVFIPHEEKTLERIFGDAYRDYKSKVRRWL
jgi:protein-S-isoprenylcysteine O-methyltransferase Ste14